MKWVKFKDKMPPVGYYSVKSKELRMALWVTETTIKTGYWLTTDFEWLDESSSSDPAGKIPLDCRTDEGIAVALVDTMITSARVLVRNYHSMIASSFEVAEALKDLQSDEDAATVLNRNSQPDPAEVLVKALEELRKYSLSELDVKFINNALSQYEQLKQQ